LEGLEERLLTRFKWGMVAELEKPTFELRRDILKKRMRRDGIQFPQEVIDYIAENVSENIRNLEGVVVSLIAHSTVHNKEIDLDLAECIIRKIVRKENNPITINSIIEVVCSYFFLEPPIIHTDSRKRDIVQARQIVMSLAKKYTNLSSSKIGKLIGDKNHATVLHACKVVQQQSEVDKKFQSDIKNIEALLKK
ncbi:Chromosomal replication initiator protein DnaA, partial [termite gut metagenome]